MKRIQRYFPIILFIITVGILVLIMSFLFNPLCRSDRYIRNKILRDIPFGTHISNAEKIISTGYLAVKYDTYEVNMENGYGFSHGKPDAYVSTKVCEKRIILDMGSYSTLLVTTSIKAFLGFDENGFLVDVSIRRTADSL